MIRASASAAALRPTADAALARRPAQRMLLLSMVLALVGTVSVGQSAAAYDRGDDIWVSTDGVAFDRGPESDEVTYVVRSASSRDDGQAFSRELTRDEQNNGWAAFAEARTAYPDGYCVVWVEVEDASNWHTSNGNDTCTAAEAAPSKEPTDRSTPRPSPTPEDDGAVAAPPAADAPRRERAQVAEPTQDTTTAPPPSPTPTPTPTPSSTPSKTPSSTPTPSRSYQSPQGALVQNLGEQPAVKTRVDAAAEQDDVISPLGWVAVLGGGALLIVGGALMLLRRIT